MNCRDIRYRIFVLGWPASLETGFQSLLGATDLLFVSHLSSAAVSAVGLVNTMIVLLLISFGTIGTGGSVLIAQYFGKGRYDRVSQYAGQIFLLGVVISTLIAISFVTNADSMLLRLGADRETATIGQIYIIVVGGTLPAALLSVFGGDVLRAIGETRIPFYTTSTALILNTGLNALFIFGIGPFPVLGVLGVAYATAFARILAVIVLFCCIFSLKKPLRFWLNDIFRFKSYITKDIIRIAWPVMVGESIWAISSFGYVLMYTILGQQILVASQILFSIHTTIVMFAHGLSVAGLALVGQALGTERFNEARSIANQTLLMTLLLSILGILVILSILPFINLFYPNIEQTAQQFIRLGLIIIALIVPAAMLNMVFGNGILRGGGDTRFVLLTDIICAGLIGVPTAYLLGIILKFGFFGVMLGRASEEIFRVLLFRKRFLSQNWMRVLTSSKTF